MRMLTVSLAVASLLCLTIAAHSLAQAQRQYQKQGKNGEQESGDAPDEPQGGFAAPPRTGTREGATGGIGINGPSIELPPLKLSLPNLRFPGITRFTSGPKMKIDEAIAPFVQNVRNEFSFPTGGQESGLAPPPGDGDGDQESGDAPGKITPSQHPDQKPFQQTSALNERQQALEARIDSLQNSIEQLVVSMQAVQASADRRLGAQPAPDHMQPLPVIVDTPAFPVQRSSYSRIERLPPKRPLEIRRLPRVY